MWQTNMPRPYLKIWKWELIFGCAVKAISSLGVHSLWAETSSLAYKKMLGSDAQNNRVIGIDWKEFVLDAMATTVCYLPSSNACREK